MDIQFNGSPRELPVPCTVAQLLELAGFGARRVAVEVNGEIVPRSTHASHQLRPGDQVEVVHALGGG